MPINLRDAAYALLSVVVIAAAVALTAFHQGVATGTDRSAKSVRDAEAKVTVANEKTDAANAQVRVLATSLNEVKAAYDRAKLLEIAQAALWTQAMTENAKLQTANRLLSQKQIDNVLKVGHEDPECTDLARLPVCPAVAERLWPEASGGKDSVGGGSAGTDL